VANATITQLPQAIGLTGSEQLEAVQAGSSVRITAQSIANLVVVNPASAISGYFLGTLTGCIGTVTGNINYDITGSACTLTAITALLGISNTNIATITGLPAIVQPATNSPTALCVLNVGGTILTGASALTAGSGTMTLQLQQLSTLPLGIALSNTSFPASGFKGLPPGWTITYSLK
jgi:hypothetical protein